MAKKVVKIGPAPKPVAGRVVIIPEQTEAISEGGIMLPNAELPQTGVVVAVDDKRTSENIHVRVNDRVLYSPYAQTVTVDGATFVILPEVDILAIL